MDHMRRLAESAPYVSCAAAALVLCGAWPVAAGQARFSDWTTVSSEQYGYQIAYPGNVFQQDARRSGADGSVFVSADGARLIVATFENESGVTLEAYREQLLDENYAGADIDFAPRRSKWFIISGTQGGMHFYERVSFTCGGRLINSWALLYPANQRRFYDRVVEAIAPTYSPGAGRTGQCD